MAALELEQDFYDEIEASLGGTLVDVELSVSDYDICVKKAIRIFKQKGSAHYRREFYALDVQKGVTKYQLPKVADADTGVSVIDTIMKIIRPSYNLFTVEDAFSLAAYNEMMHTRGLGKLGGEIHLLTHELTLWLREHHERMAAHDVDFNHDPFRQELLIFNAPKKDEVWFLDCYVELDIAEMVQLDWVVRWTIAEAREMLGNAYQKFSSLSGPTGEFQLAGSELISKGEREKEALLQEIKDGESGATDIMGIRFG